MQLGVVPVEAVAVAVLLEQLQLGDPVQLAGAQHRVALQPVEHRLPAGQHVDGLLVGVRAEPVLDVLLGQVEVLHLQLHGGQLAAVGQRRAGACRVGSCETSRRDRTGCSTARSTPMNRSSIIASTSEVVPTLR